MFQSLSQKITQQKTIADTLEFAARRETFTQWEAIVVNDGSTDATADIVADFAERDTRFRIHTQPKRPAKLLLGTPGLAWRIMSGCCFSTPMIGLHRNTLSG